MNKKICILLACHTDSLKKYFTLLNNIHYLNEYNNDIYIINSIDAKYSKNIRNELENFNYVKNYFEIKNDKYLDFGKWIYGLYKIKYNDYDYVLFMNDSVIVIESLENYFLYIENLPENINIYGYNDSSQLGKYHYQSYLFLIHTRIMNKFINLFRSKQHLIHNQESVIIHLELNIIHIDKSHDCFLKIANEYNSNRNLYWENEELYENMINRNLFHLFKIKKIVDYIKFYKFDIIKYIDNFDVEYYKKTYKDDLSKLNDNELYDHFKGYGFQEGRSCIEKFYGVLPKFYIDKLKKKKLDYLFNIPENFDIFLYKIFNKSLKDLNNNEILYHFYEHGQENENVQLKNNFNDNIKKNEVYKFYIKLYYNLNIELTSDFNYNQFINNNNDLKDKSILKNIIGYYYSLNIKYSIKDKQKNKKEENKNQENKNKENKNKENKNKENKNKENKNNNLNSDINLDIDNMDIEFIQKVNSHLKNSSNEVVIQFYNNNIKNNKQKDLDDLYLPYYKKKYNLNHLNNQIAKKYYKYRDCLDTNNIFNTFNPTHYKLLNKNNEEINNLNDDYDLKKHYFTTGYIHNLPYSIESFKPIIYKILYYEEFKNFNTNQLISHYLENGYHEKRKIKLPNYFHEESYKKIENIQSNNSDDIILHFINKSTPNTKKKLINYYKSIKNEKIFNNLDLIPKDFDIDVYKLLNNDLSKLSNIFIKLHYLEYGFEEERIYKLPDNFNIEYYKYLNKDLSTLNNNQLIIHYFNYGIKEDRLINLPSNFYVDNYQKLNPDLIKLNSDQLIRHFIKTGYHENRIYYLPYDFTPIEYQKIYKDLKKLKEIDLCIHYAKLGIKEDRAYKIDKNFNVKQYKKFYKDVENISDEDALEHYATTGLKEGRIYELPKDFDLNNYKNLHFDLTFMNDNEVLEHFIYHGIQEKRQYNGYNKFYKKEEVKREEVKKEEAIISITKEIKKNKSYDNLPNDFNVQTYRSLHPDLIYYDNDEYLMKHYIEVGSKENRLYKLPDDFDPILYNKLNPDLGKLPNNKLIEHFKSFGIKENRMYKFPDDFDYDFYKLVYLNNNNNYNDEKIKKHYIDNGIIKKHWIKLPEDFDFKIYKKLNQDLEKLNETEIIKQFVKIGHKTRIYK